MSAASRFGYLYLAYLSRPAGDRAVYRLLRKLQPRRIVEVGLGLGVRTQRLIAVAQRYLPAGETLRYTGVDLFEDSGGRPSMTLKGAYRTLRATGAKIRLEPGDPGWALARAANSLADTDLLLISAGHDAASLERAWFYVPRMLHAKSTVLLEVPAAEGHKKSAGATTWRQLDPLEIARLARQQSQRRAA